jgi:hypothetical protein
VLRYSGGVPSSLRLLLAFFAVAALAGPAATIAAPRTTGPGLIIPLRVTLTDRGPVFSAAPRMDLDTTILFIVTNRATKPRWFSIGNTRATKRMTHLLRRGKAERFYFVFRVRGKVRYESGGPGVVLRGGTFRVV